MNSQANNPERWAQSFSEELRVEMARQRQSISALAEVLGVTVHTASRRVNGHVPFDIIEMVAAAQWLGIDLVELVTRASVALAAESELAAAS